MFIGQYSISQFTISKQLIVITHLSPSMKKLSSTSQQTHLNPLTMNRKATIKRHSDTLTFSIYQNNNRLTKIQISPHSTVGQLLAQVKEQLGVGYKDFIGLASRDNNQMIDYTLKMKHFVLGGYGNNMEFEIQRRGQVLNDIQASLGDFQFLKLLGSGVSASVYLVRHRSNGMLYAMKQIKKSYFKQYKRMQQVLRERKIMIQMIGDLPFTTRLIGSFESQKFLNFVIEYYPGGEMFFHLQKRRLFEEEAKLYVAEMVVTFQKLHQRKVIYRDLKPENIMIDFQGHARLGDFGLCRLNLQYYDLTYSYCGSQQYMAPQVKSESGYNYSVDFYTLGSFAYELVTGVPPYYNNQQLTFPSTATNQYIQLVTRLIQSNMHKRLKSFGEIKRLKWFRTIQWKKVLEKRYQMPFRLQVGENYIGEEFRHQVVDPEILEEGQFDQLLECFSFVSEEKGGFGQFYNRKKDGGKKVGEGGQKKKRCSFQSANDHNQDHTRKSSHSKTSQRSSHSSNSKKSQLSSKPNSKFLKKNPLHNIYTTNLTQKSSKKLSNMTQTSRSKSHKKLSNSNSQDKNNFLNKNKFGKKSQKVEEKPQKLTMKKVKSTSNLIWLGNNSTYNKVVELRNVFSPMRKMVSPKKLKSTQL